MVMTKFFLQLGGTVPVQVLKYQQNFWDIILID